MSEMTSRQRWLHLLNRTQPDRVATDYQATAEVTARLLSDLHCADQEALWRKLHIDGRRTLGPRYTGARRTGATATDMWGIGYRQVDYGSGTYAEAVNHPLAAADSVRQIDAYAWPDPADFDYAGFSRAVAQADDRHPIHAGGYEPFLLYGSLRGLEQAFEDLVLNPALVEAILAHLFEFYWEYHQRLFAAGGGRIDTTFVAEDLGSQTGPLLSLDMYRRYLLPNQVRMADLARRFGIHVMYHTDGAARVFLPDLVDRVGIEVLNPIQWRCPGMEREGLVRDFGDRVIFHGAMDNQQTLAFGSVRDVIAEVKENLAIFRDARWICAPCHNLQPVTPTENIVALYETIGEYGRLS